jgi:hypothetical protein
MPRTLEEIDTALAAIEATANSQTKMIEDILAAQKEQSDRQKKLEESQKVIAESISADIEDINKTLDKQVGIIDAIKISGGTKGEGAPEEETPKEIVFPTFDLNGKAHTFKAAFFKIKGDEYSAEDVVKNEALLDWVVAEYPGLFSTEPAPKK